jgi:hypothetical protein
MVSRIMTVSANTSFIFDFQASFGLFGGWAVSLVCICLLDYSILLLRRLQGPTLLALTAAFLTAQHSLVSSAFTTCLSTHGILLIAVVAWFVGRRYSSPIRGLSTSRS